MVIDVGNEIIADKNIEDDNDGLNLDDMLNEENDDNNNNKNKEKNKSENKIEEIKKSVKNEIIEEEEDDDEEEDFSDKEEEFIDDNLFVQSEKCKERNNQLKKKLRKISKKWKIKNKWRWI